MIAVIAIKPCKVLRLFLPGVVVLGLMCTYAINKLKQVTNWELSPEFGCVLSEFTCRVHRVVATPFKTHQASPDPSSIRVVYIPPF